jgi:high-affinity Fe2+/Pb2+ permease
MRFSRPENAWILRLNPILIDVRNTDILNASVVNLGLRTSRSSPHAVTAIIVFREVLEAALVISIVTAASKGVARRGFWVSCGLIASIVGAGSLQQR